MDFERASIKALFYDYPVEAVVKAIEDARRNKDGYMDILPQLVRWREDAFTTTEARLMENLAQDIWMSLNKENAKDSYIDRPYSFNIPFIYRPFLLVRYIANNWLVQDQRTLQPKVKFEELLRWKDTTLFIGEDLFTTAFVANQDLSVEPRRQTAIFNWQDYIGHSDQRLSEILDKGVTDIHAHYNASADVFALNWISLMNSLSLIDKHIEALRDYQDITLSTPDTERLCSYKRMCIAAAFLRLQFFKILNNCDIPGEDRWQSMCNVKGILEDEIMAGQARTYISNEICILRAQALFGSKDRSIDYAIRLDEDVKGQIKDANLIFHGERKLMYQFFVRFYNYDSYIWSLAPCFYLYIVLKTRIRKEFVQINQLKGFENFETYQDRKSLFIENQDPIGELYDALMLQTTIHNNPNNKIEGRVSPKELRKMANTRLRARNFQKGVFVSESVVDEPNKSLSLVVHFIKANYSKKAKLHDLYLNNRQDFARYSIYREQLKKDIEFVLDCYDRQRKSISDIRVVGIDAASTEMFCRPEVFGHIFRYARKKGLSNQTYHVGEDFFDIVDGLRAIDEALLFLGLDSHCRIGHGLAMGVDAKQYYTRRRFRVLAPRQYVLDNCVWLCMTASKYDIDIPNSLETQLNEWAEYLYKKIGYEKRCGIFSMSTYWNSMLLRGDEPMRFEQDRSYSELILETDWQKTAYVNEKNVNRARQDSKAGYLYWLYNFDHEIKENGDVRFQDTYLESIVDVVDQLQAKMRRKVCAKQIAVECNPTSNLKIGFIDNYCEHPLLQKFDPIEHQADPHYPLLNASVNTDDRGVFATTLYNEFSLLALGMMKEKNDDGTQKYGSRQIMEYIEHLRQAGEKQRFKVD